MIIFIESHQILFDDMISLMNDIFYDFHTLLYYILFFVLESFERSSYFFTIKSDYY